MKESTLIKMQQDLKLTQQAVVVALHKIEKLEAKFPPELDEEKKDSE